MHGGDVNADGIKRSGEQRSSPEGQESGMQVTRCVIMTHVRRRHTLLHSRPSLKRQCGQLHFGDEADLVEVGGREGTLNLRMLGGGRAHST